MPATPANVVVTLIELTLLIAGCVLLWRHVLRPSSRSEAARRGPALAAWDVSPSDFLLFVLVIIGASLVATFVSGLALSQFNVSADTKTVLTSAAFQIGLLIGAALLPLQLGHHALRPLLSRGVLLSGVATFLIALPIITVVNLVWLQVLELLGLPAEQQDLLRMFSHAESSALLVLMIGLATLVAPLTEELLFRATFFRYLRTRSPRWVALLVPGVVFAALHVNWAELDGIASFVPLIALAMVFSVAYERTGQIGTAIVAHALFNLHTIAILFSGVSE